MQKLSRLLTVVGATSGLLFLLLQIYLTISARLDNGDSLLGALWFFFTFFTILTNIGIAMVHGATLGFFKKMPWLKKATTRTMFAGAIAVVMGVYHFVLAGLWQPQGLFAVADMGLHYVTPIIYLAWWAIHQRTKRTNFAQIPTMLIPPIAYLIWAMGRGLITNEYPYPFLNLSNLGVLQTSINIVSLFIGLSALFAVLIAIENRLQK